MPSSEPEYKAISRDKLAQLEARIPQEWRLSPQWIPAGMLSPAESIANLKYDPVNVMDIARRCGLLNSKELEITEKWDVRGLLGEIAGGRLSARDTCLAFCKRAAISHQLTRCLTEPLFKEALTRASQLDEHFKRTGKPIGPLHGLPVSVKDTFDIKGVDTTIGVASLANKPATQDAVLVQLLYHLGAVIVAKTNVPQTMLALDSVNYLFGRTLNPLNRQLTAGGSSGGEGVLVAMRGSMVGFGTDIGGSIRVPAMCAGIYGFKPGTGRVPFGGQMGGVMTGRGRIAIATVVGPIARSVADIDAIMKEIVPRAEVWGEDGIPGQWPSLTKPKRKFTVGVLRSDGLVQPLPPIAKILDEVAQTLAKDRDIEVVEIPVPKALSECQKLAGQLMYVDGGSMMMDLMDRTKEPFVPWLQGRVQRSPPMSVPKLMEIQHRRAEVEREMMKIWTTGSQDPHKRTVDAIIHPVAPHPIPELDRYNATGYTSSWVLLDCPAGVVPVRNFNESDLELGKEMDSKVIGSWDKKNRELWNSKTVDRRVYLNSPLSIQVITPKHHDHHLCVAMDIIDRALGENRELRAGKTNALKL